MNYPALRNILKCGSIVFGASALFILTLPTFFLKLLSLENITDLTWYMRMIGMTVFALAVYMWNNASHANPTHVANVAKVMCISATALGAFTLMSPAELIRFTYLYPAYRRHVFHLNLARMEMCGTGSFILSKSLLDLDSIWNH